MNRRIGVGRRVLEETGLVISIVLLVAIVVLAYFWWADAADWEEVHASYRDTAPTVMLYSLLHQHGLRCKLKTGATGGRIAVTASAVLLVHKKDLVKARALISEQPHLRS